MVIFSAILFFIGNYFVFYLNIDTAKFSFLYYAIFFCIFPFLFFLFFKKLNAKIRIFLNLSFFIFSGFLFGIYNSKKNLNYKIPNNIFNQIVYVSGKLNSILDKNINNRFELNVDYIKLNTNKYNYNYQKNILISFGFDKTNKNKRLFRKFKYGDDIELKIKLITSKNKKLYDYYLTKNIIANAYLIEVLDVKNSNGSKYKFIDFISYFKNVIYNKISEYTVDLNNKFLIHGLILGDKSNIAKDEKLLFQNTGVSHLLAISGMHLGAVFLFGCYLFGFIWKSFYKIIYLHFGLTNKAFSSIGGLIFIVFYGVISGFAIPTIRAFIFLLINSLSIFLPIRLKRTDVIGLTLFLIVLINPFCYLDLGFWLSFSIVTMLLYLNNIELKTQNKLLKNLSLPLKLFIFSTPITLLFFQKVPMVSPIVNIIAIPYINFIVLPLLILSLIFILNPELSKFFLSISNILLDNFISFLKLFDLQYFLNLPVNIYFFWLLSIFCLLLFMPNKVPGKLIGGLALVLILFR